MSDEADEGCGCFLMCLGIAAIILAIGGCTALISKADKADHKPETSQQ